METDKLTEFEKQARAEAELINPFAGCDFTDQELGNLFAEQIKDIFRYNITDKSWVFWNGKIWETDSGGSKINEQWRIFSTRLNDSVPVPDRNNGDIIRKMDKGHHYIRTKRGKDNILAIAQCTDDIPIKAQAFDRKKNLIALQNGTYNFDTCEFSTEHRQTDYLTKMINVNHNSEQKIPMQFNEFLAQIFGGDEQLIDFVQEALGYTLSGSLSQDSIFYCYGTGGNGKDVLSDIIKGVFEKFSRGAPQEMFNSSNRNSIEQGEYKATYLEGVRALFVPEAPQGKADESALKYLSGSSTLVARHKYGRGSYEFVNMATIWINSNYRLKITGTDTGIWRRMIVIPFLHNFVIDKKNRKDRTKYVSDILQEKEAILNWIIQGWERYKQSGRVEFKLPVIVKNYISEYRQESDDLSDFENYHCERISGNQRGDTFKAIYDRYLNYCKNSGDEPLKKSEFKTNLSGKDITIKKAEAGKQYCFGIKLKQN